MKERRLARVIANMEMQGLEQILVTSPASVFYLTGAWVEPGKRMLALHIHRSGEVKLFANRLFALPGVVDAPLVEYDDTEDCVAVLAAHLRPGTLGIDKLWPSQFTIRLMDARPDVRPALGSGPVDDARMLKDAEEIARMRESSQKNDIAIVRAMEAIRLGATELSVAAAYEKAAAELGAMGTSFQPLICFGKNCAEPHHETGGTELRPGDSVILDLGLLWKRYASDMTRTVFFGEPTDEQKRVHEIVRKANEIGRKAARPGIEMREIDRAVRGFIEDAGYGPNFLHRTGHGIGMEVHEPPNASAVDSTITRPGMVFSVEPGIYLPGRFGVRVEDLVAVTETGCETLNSVSHELRILR